MISHLSLGYQSDQALNSGNYNSNTAADKSSVEPLTGEVLSKDIVEKALQSAPGYLKGFATAPDFNAKMNLAFGNNWNAEVASELVQEFTGGNFSNLPGIEILPSATLNGANGAFASVTNTIYLSQEFIAQNAGNPGAITSVLLEEIGHYIDSKINVLDAAGDEGEIFAATIQGKQLSEGELLALKAEDDTATITLDGKAIGIEMDNTLGSARNIGTLSGTQTFSDFVGTADTNDFYRFTLNSNSNFSLTLNGLSGNADVQLIQDVNNNGIINGNDVLQRSQNVGTTPDAISRTLNAGTYFALVYPISGVNTNYNLSLTANPVVSPPTVTISATDASAAETLTSQTPNPGQFTITRTGSTTTALTVNYSVGGTATNGSDYSSLTGSVVIPVGATSVTLPINVIDDTQVEGNESLTK
ncbi:Calx-beta domain-containing protein [Microseira sp. BLCC-F43]